MRSSANESWITIAGQSFHHGILAGQQSYAILRTPLHPSSNGAADLIVDHDHHDHDGGRASDNTATATNDDQYCLWEIHAS